MKKPLLTDFHTHHKDNPPLKILSSIMQRYYDRPPPISFFTLIDSCKHVTLPVKEMCLQMNDIPSEITLEITRECPLNCMICSSNGGEKHPYEMSLDNWMRIIDESVSLGARSFLLSGGEPFCSDYFRNICEYIKEKNVLLSIYTSGNKLYGQDLGPLSYDDLHFVSKLGSVKLIFSLEGSNKVTHDLLTSVKGSFINTLSSIKLAVELGLCTEVHFVPTAINYQELPDLVLLAKKIGVEKVSVLRFVPQGRGKDNEESLALNNDDLIRLRETFDQLTPFGDYVRLGSPFNSFLLTKNYQCTAGQKRMTIRYDGRVVPCEAMKYMAEGFNDEIFVDNDVLTHSLKGIWEDSSIFKLARAFHTNLSPECISCEYLHKCFGGCPAQKLIANNLNKPDPYCKLQRKTMQTIVV